MGVFKMREHLHYPTLERCLRKATARIGPWSGRVFRAVEMEWARLGHLLSGQGTRRNGSRWLRAGITPVVHGATSEALAIKESRAAFVYYGIQKPQKNPRVSVEIEISLHDVLNLCPVAPAFPNLTDPELLSEDWQKVNCQGKETLAQAIGRAAWVAGLEGLLVPSARDRRGRNLVWFPENIQPESGCAISGEKELKRWLAD